MMSTLKVPSGQVLSLVAAIATVAMYAARIDSRVSGNEARIIELKKDLASIKRDVVKHGEHLATLKADSKHIIRALESLQRVKAP